jgi:hypothetical protein
MKQYSNTGTFETPTINFNLEKGELEIEGRSIPENPIEFYNPFFEALDKYQQAPQAETKVDIKLDYFNSSSSKCILDVFKKLEGINQKGSKVTVYWHYEEEDENMLTVGEDFKGIIQLPFVMVKISED